MVEKSVPARTHGHHSGERSFARARASVSRDPYALSVCVCVGGRASRVASHAKQIIVKIPVPGGVDTPTHEMCMNKLGACI